MDYNWIQQGELDQLDDEDMWSDGFLDESNRIIIDQWRANVRELMSNDNELRGSLASE